MAADTTRRRSRSSTQRPIRRISESSYETSTKTSTTDNSLRNSKTEGGLLRVVRRKSEASDSVDNAPSSNANSATISDEEQKREDRRVCMLRTAMIATLISATVVVASLTFVFVHNGENQTFLNQYQDSVAKVAQAFQHGLDTKRDVAQTFSAIYTSRYGNAAQNPPIWPNATMPDFEQQAAAQLRLSDGRALSFNPIITQGVDRLSWEAHANETASILGAPSLVEPPPNTTWPDNRTVAFGIYSRDPETKDVISDPGYSPASEYPNVMVPVWQIAPIQTNEKAVMFNLHSEPNRMRALDDMLTFRVVTLTAILQLVQDTELRPSAILFYPVFDEFNDTVKQSERNVVGSISVVFSWDDLLRSILPNYIKGMICVLKSSIGQMYSYSVSGGEVTLLGEGDLHDPKFTEMGRTFNANLALTDETTGVVDNLITYSLSIYPSQEFEDQYITNRATIYTAGVVLIFVCTAGLFLLYDYLVENRQQRTARLAKQTSTIVDSMFPAAFRERLYKSTNASAPGGTGRRTSINGPAPGAPRRRSSINSDGVHKAAAEFVAARRLSDGTQDTLRASNTTPAGIKPSRRFSTGTTKTLKQIDKFMKNVRCLDQGLELQGEDGEDEPIAELFLDTSIMFSDIVGFTKWSSERSPHEVFKLLERLFWEFDDIAARLNVFKLGTIGDCYIAVTGIPDPIDDHATLLTQFAFECRDKVREVCADLEAEGLDTAKLDMRFGIHSGAITAGILRGTKSRFELFGDTINTASRMESTGKAGKIQLSAETAQLLRLDNMGRWLTKREDKVTAKGKGELQTYWAERREETSCHRVSFSDNMDSLTLENLQSHSVIDGQLSEKYYNAEYENSRGDLDYDEEKAEISVDTVWIQPKASNDSANSQTIETQTNSHEMSDAQQSEKSYSGDYKNSRRGLEYDEENAHISEVAKRIHAEVNNDAVQTQITAYDPKQTENGGQDHLDVYIPSNDDGSESA
ncbi:hypothetical protein ACHAW6_010767 [Cyclotella cf. meneghiniana]